MVKNNEIISFLQKEKECTEQIIEKNLEIKIIIDILVKARDKGKTIYTIGNGGSGSTASHFVSDLLKTSIIKEKKRFKAISLVDNIPVVLAWSNDSSYDEIFEQQLRNYLSDGDVLIVFSGSGNSKNLLKALKYASNFNVDCIGFSGKTGGKMKNFCKICFQIPSNDMLLIESQHVMICHCIISFIRNQGTALFKYE
jgi:D-sedoheptulose 7-phosphate isomerase